MSERNGRKSRHILLKALGVLALIGLAGCHATPTTLVAVETQTYVVQPGDTPLGVALMFGTDVSTLIALNAEKHPEMGQSPIKFNAGWTILVPKRRNAPASTASTGISVVQTGAATPAAAPASSGYFDEDGAQTIIRLTNEARAAAGVQALTVDERLMEIARKWATEIVSDWGHQGLADDCSECGENIVKGPDGPQADFESWMNSDSHRNNLLYSGYVTTGVARYVVGRRAYAVQIFHE